MLSTLILFTNNIKMKKNYYVFNEYYQTNKDNSYWEPISFLKYIYYTIFLYVVKKE